MTDRSPSSVLEAAVEPPPPPPPSRRQRAPRVLWSLAVAVLIPVSVPLIVLIVETVSAGRAAADTLFSERTGQVFAQTLLLTATVTAGSLAVGTTTAWLTVRTDLRLRRVWSVLVAIPLVIPSYVVALVLLGAFGGEGVITAALGPLGVERIPALVGAPGAFVALTIATYPFTHLIVSAALRRTDPALEEAARGLGASGWRTFWSVVVPQVRPSLAAAGLLSALYAMSDFGAVSLMRFDALTRVVYAQYQGRLDRTPALVLAAALVATVLVILWLEQRSRGRGRAYTSRPRRRQRPLHLHGTARAVGYALLATVVAVALIVPLVVLISWLVRADGFDVRWGAAVGSVSASAAAALLAAAAAIPVAVLVVRHRSTPAVVVDRAIHSVFALPHIAVGLAMVVAALQWAPVMYQSLPLLIITYVVVFLPQASGAARGALEQVNPHVEEAARSLGKGPLATLMSITVPLIRPGLAAGAALVFLTSMKELPATLLLRPTGFDTLAVDIWSAASEGLFSRASAPALVLLLISAIPMYLLVARTYEP